MKAALDAQTAPDDDAHETRLTVVRGVGRPVVHAEPWSKITIVMQWQHVVYLDLVSLCIRAKHPGWAIHRTELVRALIEFMQQSGIDFSEFSSADEITEYLVEYFRGIPQSTRLPLLESGLFNSTRGRRGRRRAIDVSPNRSEIGL
jgi:hypothetical protein